MLQTQNNATVQYGPHVTCLIVLIEIRVRILIARLVLKGPLGVSVFLETFVCV